MHDDVVDDTQPLEICDPHDRWKKKTMRNFRAVELQVQVFKNGELVYDLPALGDIKKRCAEQIDTLWDEVLRFDNPHNYYVDLSQKLWDEKQRLLAEHGKKDEQ